MVTYSDRLGVTYRFLTSNFFLCTLILKSTFLVKCRVHSTLGLKGLLTLGWWKEYKSLNWLWRNRNRRRLLAHSVSRQGKRSDSLANSVWRQQNRRCSLVNSVWRQQNRRCSLVNWIACGSSRRYKKMCDSTLHYRLQIFFLTWIRLKSKDWIQKRYCR